MKLKPAFYAGFRSITIALVESLKMALRREFKQFILILVMNLASVTATCANPMAVTVSSDPDGFSKILLSLQKLDREYFYCATDIEFFDDIKSINCIYTISKMNIVANANNIGLLSYDDRNSVVKVLDILRSKIKRRN